MFRRGILQNLLAEGEFRNDGGLKSRNYKPLWKDLYIIAAVFFLSSLCLRIFYFISASVKGLTAEVEGISLIYNW